MKKNLVSLIYIIFIFFSLSSCDENKNIRYFNLNIELDEPISNLKVNDPLPLYLQTLVNYIDTSCSNELLVPNVVFQRNDLKAPNSIIIESPLSWLNQFRKGRNMLPSGYLKEDYDKLLGDIKTPKLLVEPKGSIKKTDSAVKDKNNVFVLNIYSTSVDSLAILRDKIVKRLISIRGNVIIYIKVVNSLPQVNLIVPAKQNVDNTPLENPKLVEKVKEMPVVVPAKSKIPSSILPKEPTKKVISEQKDPIQSEGKTPVNSGRKIEFPNGDIYIGDVIDGKPNGLGTKTFKNDCQIYEFDSKKQRAKAGEYLVGVWRNGVPQTGKLFDPSGKKSIPIVIGGE